MSNSFKTSDDSLLCNERKDSVRLTQKQTIFHYLQTHTATASMVTEATGVLQKCITRYKRDLEKAGLLWKIEKKDCKLTGFKAWYITTDPAKAPKRPVQLTLFSL